MVCMHYTYLVLGDSTETERKRVNVRFCRTVSYIQYLYYVQWIFVFLPFLCVLIREALRFASIRLLFGIVVARATVIVNEILVSLLLTTNRTAKNMKYPWHIPKRTVLHFLFEDLQRFNG